jgi:hypothetical protein
MDLTTLENTWKRTAIYFPVISWAYILDKTNDILSLFFLMIVLFIAFLYTDMIKSLIKKVNPYEIAKLIQMGKRSEAVSNVVPKISPSIKKHTMSQIFLHIALIISLISAFLGLLLVWESLLARFLFYLGLLGIFLKIIRIFKDSIKYIKHLN